VGTCCSVDSTVACLNPQYGQVSAEFAVGGGVYDGDPETPNRPHLPFVGASAFMPARRDAFPAAASEGSLESSAGGAADAPSASAGAAAADAELAPPAAA